MRYIFSAFAVVVIIVVSFFVIERASIHTMAGFDEPETGGVLGVNEVIPAVDPEIREASSLNFETLGLPDMALPIKVGSDEFALDEGNAVVMDVRSGNVIFAKEHEKISPIASITKLATALVFLDNNPGWDKEYVIKSEDRIEGGRIYLYRGDRVTVENLFYASLVASDNTATKALVRASGLSEALFINEMNSKMQDLGLLDTSFADLVGLSSRNISTPFETARLVKTALGMEEIRRAILMEKYQFNTLDGRSKTVYNTNALVGAYPKNGIDLLGGKTGYTDLAGYCFAGMFKDGNGEEVITVFLGGSTINSRFDNTEKMLEWTYKSHEWR